MLRLSKHKLVWNFLIPMFAIAAFCVFSLVTFLPQKIKDINVKTATESAIETAGRFKILQKYYTDKVISKVAPNREISVSYDHDGSPTTVPLPATMIHDLSKAYSDNGISIKLYSKYSFLSTRFLGCHTDADNFRTHESAIN